ncbi:hypothetical protein FQN55_005618 [Onygenales sp. PD_40]|nr:hypothetical protein FQN55_005618 [Onygenales sp. PD_40]
MRLPPLHPPPLLRSPTIHTPIPPHLNLNLHPQTRPFLTSLLPSSPNTRPPPRTLTATRTLPYPPQPLFSTISDVASYSKFLPFLTASTVTARDAQTGLPSRAFLTVGYGPLSETFTSVVTCDRGKWVVGARSGVGVGVDSGKGEREGSGNGLFEFLDTVWRLEPVLGKGGKGGMAVVEGEEEVKETKVELQVRFQFRSAMHAAMMSAVEGQVAGMMIEAFERRVREVGGR